MMQRAVYILCAVDLALWVLILAALLLSGSDPATAGLDTAAAAAVTILFALTALPAFLLARARRALNLSLGLALAFPGAFTLLLIGVAVSLP